MPFAFVLLLLSVPLAGGRLAPLSDLRLRLGGLVVLSLALQVLMTSVLLGAPRALLIGLHLTSYVTIAVALWANRRVPGLLIIAGGGATNAAVIALNGGTLPASARALREAGYTVDPAQFANSGVLVHPILPWLGDIAATPAWLPFRNVISIGDMVILVGAAVLLHTTCRYRARHALRSRGSVRGRPQPPLVVPRQATRSPALRADALSLAGR